MGKWEKRKISDISSRITSGGTPSRKRPDFFGGKIPWLKTKEINFNRIFDTEEKITDQGFKNSSTKIIEPDSVIIAMYGATAGKVAVNKLPLTTNQACCNITVNSILADFRFIYYKFVDEYEKLKLSATGAAQQNLSVGTISNYEILLPPLPEQHAIADVLAAFDDKIDLLHHQNETLEALAQTLFRQWFVEEVEHDWEVNKLSDYCDVVDCLHAKKPEEIEPQDNSKYLLQVFNISEGGSIDLSQKYYVSDENYKEWVRRIELSGGDLIISKTGRVGAIAQIPHYLKAGMGRNLVVIHPKDPFTPEFLRDLMLSKWMNRKIKERTSDGTILRSLHVKSISALPVIFPGKELITQYSGIIKPFHRKIMENLRSIEILKKLRDTLLPKLMGGEVRARVE